MFWAICPTLRESTSMFAPLPRRPAALNCDCTASIVGCEAFWIACCRYGLPPMRNDPPSTLAAFCWAAAVIGEPASARCSMPRSAISCCGANPTTVLSG